MNQVIWSPEAEDDFSQILKWLDDNWDNSVALKFITTLNEIIDQIQNNPYQFPLFSNSLNIRRTVVNKQNSLFYRTENQIIYILRIFDTRQAPDKLSF